MPKSKVKKYKVWVHIEGLNKDGDCIEGDDYYEPREAGCVATLEEAERLQDALLDAAGAWRPTQKVGFRSE